MAAKLPAVSPLGVRMWLAGIAFWAIGLTAAIVYVPWAWTSRRNIDEVVAQINAEIERNTAQEVTRLFDNVTTTQKVIQWAVTEGWVNLGADQRGSFFLSLLRANPNFTFVQFAYANGDYIGAQRVFGEEGEEKQFHLHFRRWLADRRAALKTTDVYRPVGNGLQKMGTEQILEPDWYGPLRPWYQDAVKTPGQPAWTVYVYRSTNTPGVDANVALTQDGQVRGVIGVGFELSQISRYLAWQNRDRPLGVFILNQKQDLIASIDPGEGAPFQEAGQDRAQLRPLAATTHPLLVPARQALATMNLDLSRRHRFVYRHPGTGARYFVSLSPLGKLDWVVGTVIPEANYLTNIDRNNRLLLALVGGFVPLAAVVVLAIADRIVGRPLAALTGAAVQVAAGDFTIRVAEVAPTREMALLAATFNRMTAQLERSRDELAEYNRTLEQRVTQRTGELQAVLDNLADGLAVISADDRLLQINPALAKMLGQARATVEGQTAMEVFPSHVTDLMVSCRANPSHVYTAEMAIGEAGVGKAVVSAICMDTPEGLAYMGAVLSVRDITLEKQVDRMKTDFVSSVSHELRTPLTSILGFAKLIHKKLTETIFPALHTEDKKVQRSVKQVRENMEIVIAEGTRLTKLINDLLDIAKMEAGKLDWHMEPLTVAELVDRALAATSALFEAKGLTVVREVAPDLPGLVGDRDRLIQVLINLLANAVKFQDSGTVTCRAVHEGDWVKISVIDQGMGIAPADIPKVFEKFKQVGDTLTNKPQGTGLGLPIAKEIVEHHRGQLGADSVLGQGSTFWFTLPVPQTTVMPAPATPPTAVSAPAVVPRVLLVVDDEANIRQLVRQELEPLGYTIHEAGDGMAALAKLRTLHPDAILLDLSMPSLNGFEVTAILKNAPHSAGIPIVIVSALDEQQRAIALGADGYVTKPIRFEALTATLEKAIAARAQLPPTDWQNQPVDLGGLLRLLQAERHVEVPPLVLVVEDDDGVRSLLRQELESRGFGVREARNGREALAQIAESAPDWITLDLLMPEMDGFELARQLKSHPATARIPIAVISVLDRCEGGLRIEADRYFTKPLDVELLVEDVRTLLREKESQQRVLICTDPQEELGQRLAQTLQHHGFTVEMVQTGEEFAAQVRQAHPDAIVVDGAFVEYYRKIQAQSSLTATVAVLVAPEQVNPEPPTHAASESNSI
ncbi:MAG: response regulator [Pseudanabaenaceae cyanobacterium]